MSTGWVVVTGASTGIGRACALRLAARGTSVLAGVRSDDDGQRLVEAAGEAKDRLVPLRLDVTDADSIAQAVTAVAERLDGAPLLGLVNNAGIALGGLQEFMPHAVWQRQFDVNVFGVINTTRALLPLLLAAKGRVVNISSVGGIIASPFMGPYHASKFAVEAITAGLRMELRPFGVWAACVEPGAVKTEIWRKADTLIDEIKGELSAEALQRYRAGLAAMEHFTTDAAKRGVSPDAVAKRVEHALLAPRPRARYLVGTDAHLMVLFHWLLPTRWFEALVAKLTSRA